MIVEFVAVHSAQSVLVLCVCELSCVVGTAVAVVGMRPVRILCFLYILYCVCICMVQSTCDSRKKMAGNLICAEFGVYFYTLLPLLYLMRSVV